MFKAQISLNNIHCLTFIDVSPKFIIVVLKDLNFVDINLFTV